MIQRLTVLLITLIGVLVGGTGLRAFPSPVYSNVEKEMIMQNEIVVREIKNNKEAGKAYEAIGLMKGKIEKVYQVLTHFEEYPAFMPNLSEVKVLEKSSNRATLINVLKLPLGKIKKYRLEMSYQKNETAAHLQWKMVAWPGIKTAETIKDTSGYWALENFGEKQGYVIALYHVYADPGPIPIGLGWIADFLTKDSVPKVVANTRERVMKRFTQK